MNADGARLCNQEGNDFAGIRDGKATVGTKEFVTDTVLGDQGKRQIDLGGTRIFVGTKEWIKAVELLQLIEHQRTLRSFLIWTFTFSLAATFLAIFLQGLGLLQLDGKLVWALASATVGQIGGLIAVMVKNVFK